VAQYLILDGASGFMVVSTKKRMTLRYVYGMGGLPNHDVVFVSWCEAWQPWWGWRKTLG